MAFSTLCSGRVFATQRLVVTTARPLVFQYPVFGSSVCNLWPQQPACGSGCFQYPVFGSSVCNPRSSRVCLSVEVSFSTLCSGRVFATYGHWLRTGERQSFSTLCSGRVSATLVLPEVELLPGDFQYPVFGSSVCNSQMLSTTPCTHTFSTLCSGRVFATSAEINAPYTDTNFQYPVFGSSVCNQSLRSVLGIGIDFQYPVFGSSVCNQCQDEVGCLDLVLSVPCVRVECLQPIPQRSPRMGQQGFQYPVFGSSVCNLPAYLRTCIWQLVFQYPVFGSSVCNELTNSWRRKGSMLSVPCVRVECLQPLSLTNSSVSSISFSTLCSGRVFATTTTNTTSALIESFSTLCSGRVFATAYCKPSACLSDAFSTLCSGRVFATGLQQPPLGSGKALSVPCVRVECLQPVHSRSGFVP